MPYTVYCHENKKNGKLYFGITKCSTRRRWGNGNGEVNPYKAQESHLIACTSGKLLKETSFGDTPTLTKKTRHFN